MFQDKVCKRQRGSSGEKKMMRKCERIMRELPEKFNYKDFKSIIIQNAGMDERTVKKYMELLVKELKWVKEARIGVFEKVK